MLLVKLALQDILLAMQHTYVSVPQQYVAAM